MASWVQGWVVVAGITSGCAGRGADKPDSGGPALVDHRAAGPYGVRYDSVDISVDGRVIPVSVWSPAAEATPDVDIVDVLGDDNTDRWRVLLDAAPADCPSRVHGASTTVAPAAGGPWPVVVSSHCHGCTRASKATIAARLASHGVVVAAPDHVGNTLWDKLDGQTLALDVATLEMRRVDLVATLDAALAGELGVDVDSDRVGAMGHSFGSVTAGLMTQDDPRVRAVVGLAAPMQNPLLPGVDMASITVPLMLHLAVEDNSISELGNDILRDNAAAAGGSVTFVEVADAGHWSLSDLCGLAEEFMPGCGDDQRQTDPSQAFSYRDAEGTRDLTAGLVTAFFAQELAGDSGAVARLPAMDGVVITAP